MTFSLCMIVKNEEKTLRECLDSLKAVMDEIIIVDTGSTDKTKEIASEYTNNIYDFEWIDDFSAARNFSFSKATCDYIYTADADEVLDEKNQRQLMLLKEALLPEVEIVQMIYVTEQINHPTENFARDLRPKLFKRLRTFNWIDPIHEIVNLNPVVFDSDIEIIHRPVGNHSGRDFKTFEKAIEKNGYISERLLGMYLRELYKAGTEENLEKAKDYLETSLQEYAGYGKDDICRKLIAVLIKYYRLVNNQVGIIKASLEAEATTPSAEICMELGYNFMQNDDLDEAVKWFYQAAFEAESDLDIASSGVLPLQALSIAYRKLIKDPKIKALPKEEYESLKEKFEAIASEYERQALEWKPKALGL